jgi:hypothetical protein
MSKDKLKNIRELRFYKTKNSYDDKEYYDLYILYDNFNSESGRYEDLDDVIDILNKMFNEN